MTPQSLRIASAALTPPQLITLKAAIIADPVAGPLRTAGDTPTLLAWCNAPTTTLAWRVTVGGADIYGAHKPVEYIARSVPERNAFDLMMLSGFMQDFTQQKTRNGIADIFSGTTNQTSRTAIFAAAQEFATNAQAILLGTAASVGGTAAMAEVVTALNRNFAGQVTADEVNKLVN